MAGTQMMSPVRPILSKGGGKKLTQARSSQHAPFLRVLGGRGDTGLLCFSKTYLGDGLRRAKTLILAPPITGSPDPTILPYSFFGSAVLAAA
jgi:hypothetical protein